MDFKRGAVKANGNGPQPLTALQLQQARSFVDAAVCGPWRLAVEPHRDGDHYTVMDANGMWVAAVGDDSASAAFIAVSRDLVTKLLDEIARLQSA